MAKPGDKRNKNKTLAEISKIASGAGGHQDKGFIGGSFTPEEKEKLAKGELNLGVRQVPIINDQADIKKEQEIRDYNESILTLDPMYSSEKPIRKILVRCFLKTMTKTKNGIYLPPDEVDVEVPTKSGQGYKGVVKQPWFFSKRAVVVAVPSSYKDKEGQELQPGVTVQLAKKVMSASLKGEEFQFSMPASYQHWSYQSEKIPENMKDRHYGYFLLDHFEIDTVNGDYKIEEENE